MVALKSDDGELVQEPDRIADILSLQYSSVFTLPSEKHTSSNMEVPVTIEDIKFDITDIAQAIDNLKPTAAAGFDGFPAQLLKKSRDALSIPLFIFWRNCPNKQEVPSALKHVLITPIFKGKTKLDAENYRPVALTSHIINIFEMVVQKNLVHHFEEANAFNDSHHGFRRGRSCLSQLLAHHNEVLQNLENSSNADVIYLDFAKAFDKTDFNVLLLKLENIGVKGKLHSLIKSFITERTQSVVVKEYKSKAVNVTSGVPQGSVLGPLLFLVLMMDIDKNFSICQQVFNTQKFR